MFDDDDARGAGKPRNNKLQVLLTREEKQAVKRRAVEKGKKVATWVRAAIARELARG